MRNKYFLNLLGGVMKKNLRVVIIAAVLLVIFILLAHHLDVGGFIRKLHGG